MCKNLIEMDIKKVFFFNFAKLYINFTCLPYSVFVTANNIFSDAEHL
jgi:hypothetical protein